MKIRKERGLKVVTSGELWTCLVIAVKDPLGLDEKQHPITAVTVYCALDRGWLVLMNDFSAPRSVLIDKAIRFATTEHMRWSTFHYSPSGANGAPLTRAIIYNCLRCGGGLGPTGCQSCGHSFNDPEQARDSYISLPPKVVGLLWRRGFDSVLDPRQTWLTEREQWDGYCRQHCLSS